MNPHLIAIHPFDPWGSKIGGIENMIRDLIRHAPEDCMLTIVGASEDSYARPLRQWQWIEFEGRPVSFYPALGDPAPNQRAWIPLSLRFSFCIRNLNIKSSNGKFVFHRIEPLLAFQCPPAQTALFSHGDPREMTGRRSEVKWKFAPWLYRWLEKNAVAKASRIYVVSQRGVEYFQERYPEKFGQIRFQPSGYRDDLFFAVEQNQKDELRKALRGQFSIPLENRWILFAGRFEGQKDPLLAIDSFNELIQAHGDASLLLAGAGSLEPAMRARIQRHGLEKKCVFLGALRPREMARAMQASDLFVMASHFEGLPIAALEAMACGLPVIAADAGELKAIVQSGLSGEVIGARSPDRIAVAALNALENPAYNAKKIAASVKDYSSKKIIRRWVEDLLSNGG